LRQALAKVLMSRVTVIAASQSTTRGGPFGPQPGSGAGGDVFEGEVVDRDDEPPSSNKNLP